MDKKKNRVDVCGGVGGWSMGEEQTSKTVKGKVQFF